MTGQITYNHGAIEALVGEVNQTSTQLRTTLDDLAQYLAPLVAEWEGESAEAYKMHQNDWNQAADALQRLLTEISQTALRGNQSMREADVQASKGWA